MMRAPMAEAGRWLCLIGAMIGALGLIGYLTGATFLTTLVAEQPPTMPNTAIALLFIGVAGALRHRQDATRVPRLLSLVAALLVLGIAVATLVEYELGTDLGIDELLISSETEPHPGRMSPPTAYALCFVAIGLLIFDWRPTARARPSEWFILCAGLIALIVLTGMLLGATALYLWKGMSVKGVALPTAVSLLLISIGLLLERPAAGFMRNATAPGPGGMLLRRSMLPAILGPVLLAVMITRLFAALGMGDQPLEIAVLVIAMTVTALALLAITAAPLNETDAALRASEAKFSGVISVAADVIISVDDEQRITIYNQGAQNVFGWTPEEVLGKPLDVLIPERFRDMHRRHVREFAAQPAKARSMGERRAIFGLRKNGEQFPAEAAISKLTLDGTHLLTVVLRDVTERVRLEREQRFLTEFSAALGASLDFKETLASVARVAVAEFTDCCIVHVVDENGTATWPLLVAHADPAKAGACEMLAKIGPEAPSFAREIMASARPRLVPEFSEAALPSIASSREQQEALRKLDPRSGIVVPMFARGKVLGTLTFIGTRPSRRYDARDLQLAEELARRASLALENARLYETAQRAIHARDEVLGIVAHDLRNPLNSILIQTELIGRRDEEQERRTPTSVATIRRAARRMNRLIQDLLDVARMEAAQLTVKRERVAADQVLGVAVDAQKPLAARSSLELRTDIAGDLPEVSADRDRLLQILDNLIGNAVKFTHAGGHITVGAAPSNGEVLFWVADTGTGIAADDLPRLFNRFWQLRQGERGGAGLGLSIVKGLVEAHGGRIWVDSTPGRGSTFFFSIPTAPGTERGRTRPAPNGGSSNRSAHPREGDTRM